MTTRTQAKDDMREQTKEELELAAEKAGRYARKIIDQGHPLSDSAAALSVAICEKPVKSTLIALGVGFIIGAIIRR